MKRRMKFRIMALGLLLVTAFTACNKDDGSLVSVTNDDTPTHAVTTVLDGIDINDIISPWLSIDIENLPNYARTNYPAHYRPVLNDDNTPPNNPVTDIGATLGRVLFFDKQLSLNNTTSCASCHNQADGFTDRDVLSTGFNGGLTGAHSMRLANARFYDSGSMFWDKRAADLEEQSTGPIKDGVEMGWDASAGGINALITKMNDLPYYPALFEAVYGSSNITEDKMQRAIAQYVRSMVSVNSKYDVGAAQANNLNANFGNFSTAENLGKRLFMSAPNQGGAGCNACHSAPAFALVANSGSTGLDANETTIFKSPSLKNVAAAEGYMHDGRFRTLAEVVEFYNSGIVNSPSLDNRLRRGNQPQRLNLTQEEKDGLVAFMVTLTDPIIMTDSKFSDPFIQ